MLGAFALNSRVDLLQLTIPPVKEQTLVQGRAQPRHHIMNYNDKEVQGGTTMAIVYTGSQSGATTKGFRRSEVRPFKTPYRTAAMPPVERLKGLGLFLPGIITSALDLHYRYLINTAGYRCSYSEVKR